MIQFALMKQLDFEGVSGSVFPRWKPGGGLIGIYAFFHWVKQPLLVVKSCFEIAVSEFFSHAIIMKAEEIFI